MTSTVPTTCPLCSAQSPMAIGRTHKDGETTYTQYGCDACLVEFWWPLKNPGAEWYRTDKKYGMRNADPIWSANANQKKTLAFLAHTRGRVLDVGCGIGNFLSAAKDSGWHCAGIDFDPDAIEAARAVTGIAQLEVADVVDYAQRHHGEQFDLITFFDVLEHVDNHNEFITSVQSILKPGGYVAMSMPYRKHARWLMKGDLPPMHLTCWDRKSLRRFLESRGFEVVFIQRSTEGIWPIILKLRFKYGGWSSLGAVNMARHAQGGATSAGKNHGLLVKMVHLAAKAKDMLIFGIPALLIWLSMIPTPKRYIDLFCIARMRER